MTRDDALRRIRACLRLSRSSNPNEAAAALRQAQKLMDQFSLDAMVTQTDVGEADAVTRSKGGEVPEHVTQLVNLISLTFGVQAIEKRARGRTSVCFIGILPAPEVAAYVFTVLRRQLEAAMTAHTTRMRVNVVKRKQAFALGWIYAVREKAHLKTPDELADERIAAYLDHRFSDRRAKEPKPESGKVSGAVAKKKPSHADMCAGFIAGQSVQLHTGMSNDPSTSPRAFQQLELL